eukprot:g7420.t1
MLACVDCGETRRLAEFPDLGILRDPARLQTCLECAASGGLLNCEPHLLEEARNTLKCRSLLEVRAEMKTCAAKLARSSGSSSDSETSEHGTTKIQRGRITVTDLLGQTETFEVERSTGLRELRQRIEQKFRVPVRNQRLQLAGSGRKDVFGGSAQNKHDHGSGPRANNVPKVLPKTWGELKVPFDSHLHLVWRMCDGNSGGVSGSSLLQFKLCWTHLEYVADYAKHLNGICIAVKKDRHSDWYSNSEDLVHLDFKRYEEVRGVMHHGKSSYCGRTRKSQEIDVDLARVPADVEGLYFFLATGADIGDFSQLEVELRDLTTNTTLDKAPSRAQSKGFARAVCLCCARRSGDGSGWDVDVIGKDTHGHTSHKRTDYSGMDALVWKLEQKFRT